MPLSAGTCLGHYDVTALLGEGGMGQVWQATDTQLGPGSAGGTNGGQSSTTPRGRGLRKAPPKGPLAWGRPLRGRLGVI